MEHMQSGKLYMFYFRTASHRPFVGMYIDHYICFTGVGEYYCYHVLFGAKSHDLVIGDWDVKELT